MTLLMAEGFSQSSLIAIVEGSLRHTPSKVVHYFLMDGVEIQEEFLLDPHKWVADRRLICATYLSKVSFQIPASCVWVQSKLFCEFGVFQVHSSKNQCVLPGDSISLPSITVSFG